MLRVGIVGIGFMGMIHYLAYEKVRGARVAAIATRDKKKLAGDWRSIKGNFGPPGQMMDLSAIDCYEDWRMLLDDAKIDLIDVCLPPSLHAEVTKAALAAGKHVLVEKPLALTVEDCLRVGRAVQQTGITLMTGFKMRYYDLVLRARELMPNPLMLTMQMVDNRWPGDLWANDPIKGGGNVLSQGCHSCDLLRFMARSDPVEVYAAGGNYYQPTGVVDNLCATFRFANGTAASWVQGDCRVPNAVSKFFLQAFEMDRSITLSDRLTRMVTHSAADGVVETRSTETGFVEENRAFLHALRNGLPAPIDHRDGLMATLMVLQAFASIRSGKPEPVASLISDLAA